jgi:hypothetical protein
MKIGGLKEYIFLIAGIIYVGAMFPMFFVFKANPASTFTTLPTLIYPSEIGCLLLMGQLLIAPLITPAKKKQIGT